MPGLLDDFSDSDKDDNQLNSQAARAGESPRRQGLLNDFADSDDDENNNNNNEHTKSTQPASIPAGEAQDGDEHESQPQKEQQQSKPQKSQYTVSDLFGDSDDEPNTASMAAELQLEQQQYQYQQQDNDEGPGQGWDADIPQEEPVYAPPKHFVLPPIMALEDRTQVVVVHFPNTVDVEPVAFNAETFRGEKDFIDSTGYKARLRTHTIRWRNNIDADGQAFLESNARIVAWSDGSRSLFVGEDCYDIRSSKARLNNVFAHAKARAPENVEEDANGRDILREVGECSQVYHMVNTRGAASEAHKDIAKLLASRISKEHAGTAIAAVATLEEADQLDQVSQVQSNLAASRRKLQQKRARQQQRAIPSSMNARFLEEDEGNNNAVDIGAIRRGDFRTSRAHADDADEEQWERRLHRAKRAAEESEEDDFIDDDDDDDSGGMRRRAKRGRSGKVVIESDDENGSGGDDDDDDDE